MPVKKAKLAKIANLKNAQEREAVPDIPSLTSLTMTCTTVEISEKGLGRGQKRGQSNNEDTRRIMPVKKAKLAHMANLKVQEMEAVPDSPSITTLTAPLTSTTITTTTTCTTSTTLAITRPLMAESIKDLLTSAPKVKSSFQMVLTFKAIEEALETSTIASLLDLSSSTEEEEPVREKEGEVGNDQPLLEDIIIDHKSAEEKTFPTSYQAIGELYHQLELLSSDEEIEDLGQEEASMTTNIPQKTSAEHRYAAMKNLQNSPEICNVGKKESVLIELSQLNNLIKKNLICKECNSNNIRITVNNSDRQGLVQTLVQKCVSCKKSDTIMTSGMFKPPDGVKVKQCRRFCLKYVQAVLNSGVGFAKSQQFMTELGLDPLSRQSFENYTKSLADIIERKAEDMKNNAADAVKHTCQLMGYSLSDNALNIAVSFDGTWQKRGHTSLYGVTFVIEVNTGLILDYHISSKYCHKCTVNRSKFDEERFEEWYAEHKEKQECSITYDQDKSGGMEGAGSEVLFGRSLKRGLRYTTLISDQDSSTYKRLVKANVYGDAYPIRKSHCLNHISKSIYRKIDKCRQEKQLKGKKKGWLTKKTGNMFANFYRIAIKMHAGDNNKIRRRIMASILHHASTDNRPLHKLCSSKYCKYKADKNQGRVGEGWHNDMRNMRHTLNPEAATELCKIMKDATSDRALNQLSAKTQNLNESLHSKVWNLLPKETFTGLAHLRYAVARTVLEHNLGIAHCDLSSLLNLPSNISLETSSCEMRKKRKRQKVPTTEYEADTF